MTTPGDPFAGIAVVPPQIDETTVSRAVRRQFGLSGDLQPLISERDQNFLLLSGDRRRFVVKVTSAAEPHLVSRFHVAALQCLQEAKAVATPEVVTTASGEGIGTIEHSGQVYLLRVVSFVDGRPLSEFELNAGLVASFGQQLATLDRRLAGFSHAGDRPVLLWDLQRVPRIRELQHCIGESDVGLRVGRAIDDYDRHVVPQLGSLRRQVIHGDANPENVLVDESGAVSGFIDFSDSVNAPLVFEPAIACAYLRAADQDPLEHITPFLVAYSAELPVMKSEFDLLFDLVRARLATTISIMFWRAALRSAGDSYSRKTLRTESSATEFLAALDRLGRSGFSDRLRRRVVID